jgi:hypothetical protein
MIVQDTLLVSYQVINGTWSIQLGLLVGSIVSLIISPLDSVQVTQKVVDYHWDLEQEIRKIRITLVFLHTFLMVSCWANSSGRLNNQIL